MRSLWNRQREKVEHEEDIDEDDLAQEEENDNCIDITNDDHQDLLTILSKLTDDPSSKENGMASFMKTQIINRTKKEPRRRRWPLRYSTLYCI